MDGKGGVGYADGETDALRGRRRLLGMIAGHGARVPRVWVCGWGEEARQKRVREAGKKLSRCKNFGLESSVPSGNTRFICQETPRAHSYLDLLV